MRRLAVILSAFVCVFMTALRVDGAEPKFAKPPVVTREGKGVRVTFAVDHATDVEVAILDAKGKVVRHLAAGLLGKNAPAPLEKDSLAQELIWDGKNDGGGPLPPGQYAVKVSLGLRAELVRFFGGHGLGGGEFVVDKNGLVYAKSGWRVQVFSREGKYLKTIMPFPANLTAEQMKGLDPIMLSEKKWGPRIYSTDGPFTYPSSMRGDASRMAITPDGTLILEGLDYKGHVMGHHWQWLGSGQRLLLVKTDGSFPRPHLGPYVANCRVAWNAWDMAASPDNKYVYVTGLTGKSIWGAQDVKHVVYRVALDGKSEVFLGELYKAGSDGKHFNNPTGVSVDGKGNIYVSDTGNNRVAVFDAGGKFVGALPVEKPGRIAVHPKSGAIYLISGGKKLGRYVVGLRGGKLLKFADFKAKKPMAEMQLGAKAGRCLALDAGVTPPAVLVSGAKGIVRLADEGKSFKEVGKIPAAKVKPTGLEGRAGVHMAVDRERDELYLKGGWEGWWGMDGNSGAVKKVRLGWRYAQVAVGPDGHIYARHLQKGIARFDRNLKPIPFKGTGTNTVEGGVGYEKGWEKKDGYGARGLYVARNGNIYYMGYTPKVYVAAWGPDGKLLNRRLIEMDGMPCGVAADRHGNVYVAANVKPKGQYYPKELMGKVGTRATKRGDPYYNWYPIMYGSLLKFGPKGGKIRFLGKGEKAPAGALTAVYGPGRRCIVEGALWHYTGLSPIWSGHPTCQCVVPRFDLDGFGRVFLPDAGQFCIRVLDANGNHLLRFGGYGNVDSQGAGSLVPVPAIPFGFPTQVGVSRTAVYVLDRLNGRIVKVKLTHTVEATAKLRL